MNTIQKKIIFASVFAISLAMLSGMAQPQIFAEESEGYNMAEDVKAILTFNFRDGVETHEFPVFSMTSDFVSGDGTYFEVKGVVGDAPHLHKALDEAFKFRGGAGLEYDYRCPIQIFGHDMVGSILDFAYRGMNGYKISIKSRMNLTVSLAGEHK